MNSPDSARTPARESAQTPARVLRLAKSASVKVLRTLAAPELGSAAKRVTTVVKLDGRLVFPAMTTWLAALIGVVAVGSRETEAAGAMQRSGMLWSIGGLVSAAASVTIVISSTRFGSLPWGAVLAGNRRLRGRRRGRRRNPTGRVARRVGEETHSTPHKAFPAPAKHRRSPTPVSFRESIGKSARDWLPQFAFCSMLAAAVLSTVVLGSAERSAPLWTSGVPVTAVATVTGPAARSGGSAETTGQGDTGAGQPSVRFSVVVRGFERATTKRGVVDRSVAVGSPTLAVPCLAFIKLVNLTADRTPEIGSSITMTGRVLSTEPGDPTACLIFADGAAGLVAAAPPALLWADDLRRSFRSTAAEYPGDGADLLPGLVVGDVSLVGEQLDAAMKVSGLSHLTAVSGANCSVIVAGIMVGGALVGLGRRSRIVLALATLAAFVVVVTPQPSVIRAAVSAVIVLVSLAWSRKPAGLGTLCLAVVVLLVLDPWLSRSVGFALSVVATAGLLVLARPLAAVFGRVLPEWLALAIAIPVSAQLMCQPLLLMLTPTLSPYSVIANLVAAPAAPIATIVGLLVCLVGLVYAPAAVILGWLAWLPSWWIATTATTAAALPGARIPWLDGVPGVLLLMALTAVGLIAILARTSSRLRRVSAVIVLIAVLGGYGGVLLVAHSSLRFALPTNWTVAVCDVGQGDAIVIRDSNSYALIDLGPEPEPLTRCLNQLGVNRLQLVVLTHFDSDHVGGIEAVENRSDTVLIGPTDGRRADAVLERFRAGGAEVEPVSRGRDGMLGQTPWQIRWPPASTTLRGNDASVVVSFGGAANVILLGDLPASSQDALLSAESRAAAGLRQGEFGIVKFAHHGSADQSDRFYSRLRASVALISVGDGNRHGHPRQSALNLLARLGCATFRTDLNGLVVVSPAFGRSSSAGRDAPLNFTVWTEKIAPNRPG